MAERREEQTGKTPPQHGDRWILWRTAPEWLRRIWGDRVREVPKRSKLDADHLRRIAYL
jgi:hypothetical protein